MSDEARVEAIYQEALDLPPERRDVFVREQCGGDTELELRVRRLLHHYDAAPTSFLRAPLAPRTAERDDRNIGPYELHEVIGEGGMGVVYRATQHEPVQRTVALKVVKLGMNTPEVIARFETERQALARLEHPNIARVYDAGSTPDGRPYFAMEYVDGVPLTRYCDERRLTPAHRVELLVQVCRGVQHAHQQGIIHRDLKPSNILVATREGEPVPKIIDFGVAKATERRLTQETLFTQQGQLIGTPEYMSPEQAQGLAVDTRTDIYSLGVVLYELLAGVLPLDPAVLREAGFEAMMRMIRETDPPRPSTRVSTLGDSAQLAADRRRSEPRSLARALRGELDWIAMKALEKSPERRYATAAELAADLRAHLDDDAVRARPPSAGYLLRKLARRHRVAAGFVVVIAVALTALAASMTLQTRRIARERDRANREAELAGEVKQFLIEVFQASEPSTARGKDIGARSLLDRGASRVEELENVRVRAELTTTLGMVYEGLGVYARADSLFESAWELWMDAAGPDDPHTLVALNDLGNTRLLQGQPAEAESLYAAAALGWRRIDRDDDPRAFDPLVNVATARRRQGRYVEAIAAYRDAFDRRRDALGEDDDELWRIRANWATALTHLGDHARATQLYEETYQQLERLLGADHPRTIGLNGRLGSSYSHQGRFEDAERHLREAVEGFRRVVGEQHPSYVSALGDLAVFYYQSDQAEAAVATFEQVVAASTAINGPEHPNTLVQMNNLAGAYGKADQDERGEALMREVLAARIRVLGPNHPHTHSSRVSLAMFAATRGDWAEVMDLLTEAVDGGYAHPFLLDEGTLAKLEPLQADARFQKLLETVRLRLED